MSEQRISAIGILGDSLEALWREKELAVLLMAFLAIVNLLALWPIMDWYLSIIPAMVQGLEPTPEQMAFIEDEVFYILWLVPVFIVISMATTVLWSRATIGGTKIAFEGGFQALFKRLLWTIWRYICAIGWMSLLILAFWIVVFVVGVIAGIGGAGFEAGDPKLAAGEISQAIVAILIFIPFYFLMLFAAMAISFLMMISFHGEARDFHLPIHRSFKLARGNLLRATGVLFLAIFGFYIVAGMIGALFAGALFSDSALLQGIAFFLLLFWGSIINFVFIAYGANYAVRLVPELKL